MAALAACGANHYKKRPDVIDTRPFHFINEPDTVQDHLLSNLSPFERNTAFSPQRSGSYRSKSILRVSLMWPDRSRRR